MPSDYVKWKTEAAKFFAASDISIGEQPVAISILFVAPRPKTTKHPFLKADIDNCVKSVMDAVTDAATVWADDWQVADLSAKKRWSSEYRPVGITFGIRVLRADEL
jgi:Holliday junction resolvase RusA-like endonuclease